MHWRYVPAILFILISGILAGCFSPTLQKNPSEAKVPFETLAFQYAQATFNVLSMTNVAASTTAEAALDLTVSATMTFTPAATETPAPTPTHTLKPSKTPVPTSSHTPIPTWTYTPTQTPTHALCKYNNNGNFVAQHRDPPVLDGDFREWGDLDKFYKMDHIVDGKLYWSGDFDLDGAFQVGWDEQNLYLAVRVQDERYVQKSDEPIDLQQGDSIEILMDTDLCGDFGSGSMTKDDYHIGFSAGYVYVNNQKYIYRWYPKPGQKIMDVNYIVSRLGETFFYEMQIPWSVFGIENPTVNQPFGFVLSINDNDDNQRNIQETIMATDFWKLSPTTWGLLILK